MLLDPLVGLGAAFAFLPLGFVRVPDATTSLSTTTQGRIAVFYFAMLPLMGALDYYLTLWHQKLPPVRICWSVTPIYLWVVVTSV